MKLQKIEDIRKRFHQQWLLIKVSKVNRTTSTPILGYLLAHSPDREEIYHESLKHKGLLFIDHSEDQLPKGYAVAFSICQKFLSI